MLKSHQLFLAFFFLTGPCFIYSVFLQVFDSVSNESKRKHDRCDKKFRGLPCVTFSTFFLDLFLFVCFFLFLFCGRGKLWRNRCCNWLWRGRRRKKLWNWLCCPVDLVWMKGRKEEKYILFKRKERDYIRLICTVENFTRKICFVPVYPIYQCSKWVFEGDGFWKIPLTLFHCLVEESFFLRNLGSRLMCPPPFHFVHCVIFHSFGFLPPKECEGQVRGLVWRNEDDDFRWTSVAIHFPIHWIILLICPRGEGFNFHDQSWHREVQWGRWFGFAWASISEQESLSRFKDSGFCFN